VSRPPVHLTRRVLASALLISNVLGVFSQAV